MRPGTLVRLLYEQRQSSFITVRTMYVNVLYCTVLSNGNGNGNHSSQIQHRPIKNPVAQHETRFFDFAADFDQINFQLI